jgi:hypothetical protein
MNRTSSRLFAVLILSAGFALAARADDDGKKPAGPPPGMMANASECAGLMQKLCGTADSPGYQACAQKHAHEVGDCYSKRMAGGSAAGRRPKSACMQDAKKYCPGKFPGSPEFSACMKSNESKLSKACVEEYHANKSEIEKHKKDLAPCSADMKRLCPGLAPQDDKFMGCMMEHMNELSPDCRAAQNKGTGHVFTKRDSICMKAIHDLCPDAQPGTGDFMQCMMQHHAELPADCSKGRGKKSE